MLWIWKWIRIESYFNFNFRCLATSLLHTFITCSGRHGKLLVSRLSGWGGLTAVLISLRQWSIFIFRLMRSCRLRLLVSLNKHAVRTVRSRSLGDQERYLMRNLGRSDRVQSGSGGKREKMRPFRGVKVRTVVSWPDPGAGSGTVAVAYTVKSHPWPMDPSDSRPVLPVLVDFLVTVPSKTDVVVT